MKIIVFILPIFLSFSTLSQNTFEDPEGKFTIDLPKGFNLTAVKEGTYSFANKDSKTLIISFVEEEKTSEELFALALNTYNGVGIVNSNAVGDVEDMMINGNQSRMGTYKGQYSKNTNVNLYGIIGGVDLPNGGIYFLSILNDIDMNKKFDKVVNKAYQTIRSAGTSISGVTEVKKADMSSVPSASSSQASAEPFDWRHDNVSLSFPAGWSEKELSRGFPKEAIGWFDYSALGGNMQVYCYKGVVWSPKTVQPVADDLILSVIPDASLKASEEVNVAGKKGTLKKYAGSMVNDGQEVELGGVTIVYKGGKCNLMLFGMCPVDRLDAFASAMLAVADTAE